MGYCSAFCYSFEPTFHVVMGQFLYFLFPPTAFHTLKRCQLSFNPPLKANFHLYSLLKSYLKSLQVLWGPSNPNPMPQNSNRRKWLVLGPESSRWAWWLCNELRIHKRLTLWSLAACPTRKREAFQSKPHKERGTRVIYGSPLTLSLAWLFQDSNTHITLTAKSAPSPSGV